MTGSAKLFFRIALIIISLFLFGDIAGSHDAIPPSGPLNKLPGYMKVPPVEKQYERKNSAPKKKDKPAKKSGEKTGAKPDQSNAGIVWRADKVTFQRGFNVIIAYGNVIITRDKLTMHADHVVLYRAEQEVYAEGNVSMIEGSRVVYADQIFYNFKTESGIVNKGRLINYAPWQVVTSVGSGWRVFCTRPGENAWTFYSEQFYKHGEHLFVGRSTTMAPSEFGQSFIRIRSSSLKMTPGKKVAAYNNILFIGPVPVMYTPFVVKDLSGKWPWITLTFGQTKEWKQYVFTKIGYYIKDYAKLSLESDYRRRQGIGYGLDVFYTLPARLNKGAGELRTYYIGEKEKGEKGQEFAKLDNNIRLKNNDRYKIEFQHSQPIDFNTRLDWASGWVINTEVHKYSDRYFQTEYFENDAKTGRLDNDVILYKSSMYTDFEMVEKFRVNRWMSETDYLPEARFRVLSVPIKESNFYYTSETRAGFLEYLPDEALKTDDISLSRGYTSQRVSYLARLGTALKLEPYVGGESTYYEKLLDKNEDGSFRNNLIYGAVISSRITGLFETKSKFWDLNQLKHIITPGLIYTGRTRPTITPDKLNQLDVIDTLDRTNLVTLFYRNNYYTKRGEDKHISEFLYWEIRQDCYPDDKESKKINKDHFLGESAFYYRLSPRDFMRFNGDLRIDPNEREFRAASTGVIYEPIHELSLYLGHQYFKATLNSGIDDSSESSFSITYKFDERWAVRIGTGYEFYNRIIIGRGYVRSGLTNQSLTLFRRQESWQFSISYFRNSTMFPVEEGIFFAIGLVGEEPFFGKY